jgi:hypothetical protein
MGILIEVDAYADYGDAGYCPIEICEISPLPQQEEPCTT